MVLVVVVNHFELLFALLYLAIQCFEKVLVAVEVVAVKYFESLLAHLYVMARCFELILAVGVKYFELLFARQYLEVQYYGVTPVVVEVVVIKYFESMLAHLYVVAQYFELVLVVVEVVVVKCFELLFAHLYMAAQCFEIVEDALVALMSLLLNYNHNSNFLLDGILLAGNPTLLYILSHNHISYVNLRLLLAVLLIRHGDFLYMQFLFFLHF